MYTIRTTTYIPATHAISVQEIVTVRKTFWERLFETDPTIHMWDKTKKVVQTVTRKVRCAYLIGDVIIVHPDDFCILKQQLNGMAPANGIKIIDATKVLENVRHVSHEFNINIAETTKAFERFNLAWGETPLGVVHHGTV